jgi:hypothetical protein
MLTGWMQSVARVVARIDWTDPQVQQLMAVLWRSVAGGPSATDRAQAQAEAQIRATERLAAALAGGGSGRAAPPDAPAPPWTAPPAAVPTVLEAITVMSGDLKESLRFAREDGVTHPEVVRRLAHVQEVVDTVERLDLRPEVLTTLPAAQRAVLEQQVLPTLRRARQAVHNGPDGGPPTVESLTEAAAALGTAATALRVTQAAAPVAGFAGAALPRPVDAPSAPSAYAPDLAVDTGCLPCGRAHLGAVAGTLARAAAAAQAQGWADPDAQAALQTAAEELAMIEAYDWTPERIARSPAPDKALLERYAPQVAALRAQVATVRDPAGLAGLAAQAQQLRDAFVRDDLARAGGPGVAAHITATPWTEQGHHTVTPPPWWYAPPTVLTVGATTVPTDTARAFDQLATALHDRGVRIRIRTTPTTAEGVLEGAYLPEQQAIILSPAALAKDAYAVQVLAHEAAHALADAPACHAYDASRPYAERPEEQFAEAASVIALDQAGLPVELFDGTEVPPGTRQVDWALVEATQSPAEVTRLRWVSQWIADAIQGVPRDYATPACPPGSEGGT